MTGCGGDGRELVSIVVPCFDVEEYVDDCIASALAQTAPHVEVVAVDDGSTDATAEHLERWRRSDDRVRVVEQCNAGLGAARNAGITAARGAWIFFLDGDDELPPDAIRSLLDSATTSGSDIACGVIQVVAGDEVWRATQQREPYAGRHVGSHLDDLPALVYDQMVCGKLFRRSFWDGQGLEFRTGVLFEDVEVMMLAHCRARSIDVVPDPVYRWRRRIDGAVSITQRPVGDRELVHRFDALRRADEILEREASPEVWAEHGRKILLVDLRQYARAVAARDEPELHASFVAAAAPTLRRMSPAAVADAPPMMGLLQALIVDGDGAAAIACARLFGQPLGRAPATVARAGLVLSRRAPRGLVGVLGRTLADRLRARRRRAIRSRA